MDNLRDNQRVVCFWKRYGYFDAESKETLYYDDLSDFCDGLARVRLDGKYGHINKKGELIIPLKYDWAGDFHDGLTRVELGGKYWYINKKDEVVVPLE